MRGVLLAGMLLLVGCGTNPAPTTAPKEEPRVVAKGETKEPKVKPQPEKKDPPEVSPPVKVAPPVEKKDPPKKEPEVRLSLAEAKVKILNLNKAGVKALLGKPDATNAGKFNGANTIVWVYDNQRIVWNADTEKYYSGLAVSFYELADGSDPGSAIEVKVN